METSIFLAQLISPILLTIAAAMLINQTNMREMAIDFLEHRGLIFLAGLLTLVTGLAIVLTHNVWVADWPVIITVFGWLSIVGGIFRIVFPDSVRAVGTKMLENSSAITVSAICQAILGIWLFYVGYIA